MRGRIEIDIATHELGDLLHLPITPDAPTVITLTSELRLTRTGRAVRLIQNNGAGIGDARPDPTLNKLVAKARSWWIELRAGETDIPTLARREGVTASYVTRVVRLAFLSPYTVEAVLAGRQLAAINGQSLTAPDAIPMNWVEQQAVFQGERLPSS